MNTSTSVLASTQYRSATARASAPAFAAALLLASAAQAGVLNYGIIVLSDDSPAGLDGGDTLQLFGTPRIDEQGNIAFLAQSPPLDPFGFNNLSIWKNVGRGLELIAKNDDPAPGTDGVFNFVGNPVLAGGSVAFAAELGGVGKFPIDGIWSDRTGRLDRVMLQDDYPPGTPVGSTYFQFAFNMVENHDIFVNAIYNDHTDIFVPFENEGLWRNRDGSFEIIALKNFPAPGVGPDVVFGEGTDLAFFGPVDHWSAGDIGLTGFNGYLAGPGITTFNDEGIWVESKRGLGLLVREGDDAPGLPGLKFSNPFGFHSFGADNNGNIHVNANGSILFGGELGGSSPSSGFDFSLISLWVHRQGELELIAMEGPSGPIKLQFAPPTPPGFGAGFQFSNALFGGLLNDHDELAIVGVALSLAPLDGIDAIWSDHAGALTLIVREGQPAPDQPAGVTFAFPVRLRGFADSGAVYFSAQLQGPGVTFANNYGLFLADPDGTLHAIARTGASFEVAPGDDRTIGSIFPGPLDGSPLPGISDDGAVAFQLAFTDGTGGLFTASSTPKTNPADLNSDGDVDGFDLAQLLAAWGTCPAPASCAADLNGDGVVNGFDLAALLAAWG